MEKEVNDEIKKENKILKIVGRVAAFIGVTVGMLVVLLYFVMLVVTHGPSERIRDLFVMSARESSAGGFLADIYLSKEQIDAIESANIVEETDALTDLSIVSINEAYYEDDYIPGINKDGEESFIVESSYDSKVYVENGIEFHEITGATFSGFVAVVADPSRVFIGTGKASYDGSAGLSVPELAEKEGAILATNGAFFVDTGGVGNGGTPIGFVFSKGKNMYGGNDSTQNMLGFTEDNILVCGKMTGNKAKELGIRDGLSCNPFLVINGEAVNVSGSGGGLNPRTALGQRADGAVIIMVIDGRQATSLGASMADVQDVMLSFGAVNAGNLDGGGSSAMYYDGNVVNNVMCIYGTRGVPDGVCVRPQ